VIWDELKHYKVYSVRTYFRLAQYQMTDFGLIQENCWMFASMLQEYLGIGGRGECVFGKIKHLTMARSARTKVEFRICGIPCFLPLFTVSLPVQCQRSKLQLMLIVA
jgi:hypothetical protein